MKKLYLMLLACCLVIAAQAQTIYQPSTQASFTGGATTYCRGDAILPLTFTYNICTSGSGAPTGASCVANWYYNTTNSTTVGTATLVSGPIVFSTPTAGTSSLNFTPVLPIGGDYYFFVVITWTGGGACSGASGTLTSTTEYVRVTPPPIISATGSMNVCVGSTLGVSNGFTGGAWTSGNTGIASIASSGPTTATVTGVSAGFVEISYTIGSCRSTAFIAVNDTPTAMITTSSPAQIISNVYQLCASSSYAFSSTPSGGTWISDNPTAAAVGISSGIVSTGTTGTARITYTNTSTGCFTRRMVSINANPAPITGSTAICYLSSTVLGNASAPAGSWISSNPVGMPVSTGGTVTGNATGTAIISYKLTSAPGCQSTTIVTVNTAPTAITGPSSVCAGSSITLANTVAGGSWSSSDITKGTVNATTGVVTGIAMGTVNISYTTAGCNPVVKTLTINPLPGTISGLLSVCYGSSTTLSSTVSGGKWYSDNETIATVDSVFGIVTPGTMGTTIISYRVGSGCFTTATVTVNPLAPILGPDTVCVGSTAALTNIVGGGTWISGNPAIAGVHPTTGIVTGLFDGISYIGYTLPTGCATTFLMHVIPALPPIAGPLQVCSGVAVVLSDGVPGGRWSTSNMYVAEIDSITGDLTGRFPDTATITYSIFGCVTTTMVTVMPLPTPSISFDWTTGKVSTLPVYASYQWYDSVSGAIPGATQSYYVVPGLVRTHYVRVTDFNGCANNSDFFRTPLAINNVEMAARCNIFPNPASTGITIDAPVRVKAVISSVEGRIVLQAENAKQVDVSRLSPGLYLIGLYDDSGQLITMRKLTKE